MMILFINFSYKQLIQIYDNIIVRVLKPYQNYVF